MTEITIDYPGLSTQITQFVDIQLLLIIIVVLLKIYGDNFQEKKEV